MKIVRYAAALLVLAVMVPMAGAIRLTAPSLAEASPAEEPPSLEESTPAEEPPSLEESTPAEETPSLEESTPAEEPPSLEESAPAEEPPSLAAPAPAEEPPSLEESTPAAEPPRPAAPAPAEEPPESAAADEEWKLLLVNPWNTLPEDFSVELVTLASCGLKVDKRIRTDLNKMFFACREAGLRPLICSAYRTQAVQTRLYNNKISRLRAAGYSKESAVEEAGHWVAVPGTSEHQTGLALDIVSASYQVLNKKQEDTPEQKWLMEHCWEYGFILRYPSDKCEITGISYEPWHYRYVGREAALAMRDSGQCLEEYLEALEDGAAKTRTSRTSPASHNITKHRSA